MISEAIDAGKLNVAAVLSGNRNFEGRVNPQTRFNYLASPPLVVAYALAGRMDIDLATEPLGVGTDGPVFLRDIWPSSQEVEDTILVEREARAVHEAVRQRLRGRRALAGDPVARPATSTRGTTTPRT